MPDKERQAQRAEAMQLLHSVVKDCTSEPAEDIIAMGEALVAMGKALQDVSAADSKAVIKSVMELYSIGVKDGS